MSREGEEILESKQPSTQKAPRINRAIRSPQVRLINESGTMEGVVPTDEALRRASFLGLDLVEVDPSAQPPVCRIADFGKIKYQAQKKRSQMRKSQHVVLLKEVQLRPGIQENDYRVKLAKARGFLEDGHKVKFVLQFQGREIIYQERGFKLITDALETLAELGKAESEPRVEGKRLIVIVAPSKKVVAPTAPANAPL